MAVSGLNSPNLYWISAQFDVNNGTADKAHFVAPCRCEILRVAFVAADGATDAGGATIKFDGVEAGTSTRGDGDVGVLTIPAASIESKMYYEEPATQQVFNPGGQVIVEVTAEGVSALLGQAVIQYREIPEVEGNISTMVAG